LSPLAAGTAAAHAETRMFSYDPISPDAKRLTGAGLTILFEPRLAGRQADQGAGHRRAGPGLAEATAARRISVPAAWRAMDGVDADASLYEVDDKTAQGKIYVRAFCPGSKRLWLSFSTIAMRRDLRIQAFGDDPKAARSEGPRLCGTLDFTYRGEWRLPNDRRPDPMSDWTDSPQHPDTTN
jgi:hypothetical protein